MSPLKYPEVSFAELGLLTKRKFVLPVNSGSAALTIALINSGIALGSEVIIPSICCPAVMSAVISAGFKPVFADVSELDFCIRTQDILKVVTERTGAIIAVHGYGRACKIDEMEILAEEHSLFLIDDACLALGGTYKGKALGSFGDVGIMSFGYDKIIDAGSGGVLLTNDEDIYLLSRQFLETNSSFDFLSDAEFIKAQLSLLKENILTRSNNAAFYDQHLDPSKVHKPPFSTDLVYWRYAALYKGDRAALITAAQKKGIVITAHYKGLHQVHDGVALKNADLISDQIINLFVSQKTPKGYMEKVVNFINEFNS